MDLIIQCPIQYPNQQQFTNFSKYTQQLQKKYKSNYGMVKIVPPKGWISKAKDYQNRLKNLIVKNPIQQNVQGTAGYFQSKNIIQQKMTFSAYKKYALNQQKIVTNKSNQEKQSLFWKTINYSPSIYGADLTGSLMDEQSGAWNLNTLDSILKYAVPFKIKGVTDPYCYIGTWKAFFSWHKQDLDLSALNFIHEGQSKIWYSIAASDSYILEQDAKNHFKYQSQKCTQFLRHKTFLINPYKLKQKHKDLKISKVQHKQGEIMLVFGGAYHCGFNCGFNIAQAINYGTLSWLQALTKIKSCLCFKRNISAQIQSILCSLEESQMHSILKDTPQYQSLQVYIHYLQQLQGYILPNNEPQNQITKIYQIQHKIQQQEIIVVQELKPIQPIQPVQPIQQIQPVLPIKPIKQIRQQKLKRKQLDQDWKIKKSSKKIKKDQKCSFTIKKDLVIQQPTK